MPSAPAHEVTNQTTTERNTMKTQAELAALETRIDFEAVNKALLDRLKRGELGQRKSVSTLLDRVGDTLVELRRHRVPLGAIVAELKTHGLEVSESRLRAYLRSRGVTEAKPQGQRKKIRPTSRGPLKTPPESARGAATESAQSSLTLPK